MENILNTIVKRIIAEEGERFDDYYPGLYTPAERPAPVDISVPLKSGFFVIAEVKKGSPSKGLFSPDLDPIRLVSEYEAGGASALSVITEKNFFFASPDILKIVRAHTNLPLLRKDFLVHPRQVYDSYNLGADFILLIAACLNDGNLMQMRQIAASLGLGVLVEIHDAEEIERALACRPELIGINNRNLKDFSVDWRRSLDMKRLLPADIPVISESGIRSPDQVRELQAAGFAGILVGEHLIRSGDPKQALQELIHG